MSLIELADMPLDQVAELSGPLAQALRTPDTEPAKLLFNSRHNGG
ncbi:hypothetical protein [Nocardia stercoris]|nr:hypothetical protein [Nocardia stercoris]